MNQLDIWKSSNAKAKEPKDEALLVTGHYKICLSLISVLVQDVIESLGIYIVSFDRPGYGESDPHPQRTPKTLALDIEELADQLELGSKFYVAGFSMGGQVVWGCLNYIPHRYFSFKMFFLSRRSIRNSLEVKIKSAYICNLVKIVINMML